MPSCCKCFQSVLTGSNLVNCQSIHSVSLQIKKYLSISFICLKTNCFPLLLRNEGQTCELLINKDPTSFLFSLFPSFLQLYSHLSDSQIWIHCAPAPQNFSLLSAYQTYFDFGPFHALLYFSYNVLHSILSSLYLKNSSRLSSNIPILVKPSPVPPNRIVCYMSCILRALCLYFNMIFACIWYMDWEFFEDGFLMHLYLMHFMHLYIKGLISYLAQSRCSLNIAEWIFSYMSFVFSQNIWHMITEINWLLK